MNSLSETRVNYEEFEEFIWRKVLESNHLAGADWERSEMYELLDFLRAPHSELARDFPAVAKEEKKKVCPDCNGSGVYQEYDEYDRYAVHSCATCDGSGEITCQSVKSEEAEMTLTIEHADVIG